MPLRGPLNDLFSAPLSLPVRGEAPRKSIPTASASDGVRCMGVCGVRDGGVETLAGARGLAVRVRCRSAGGAGEGGELGGAGAVSYIDRQI